MVNIFETLSFRMKLTVDFGEMKTTFGASEVLLTCLAVKNLCVGN